LATLLVSDPVFLEHLVLPGQPERPDRLRAIAESLAEEPFDALLRKEAAAAGEADLALAHDEDYIALIRDAAPTEGFVRLDPDTAMMSKTWTVACHAAGAAMLAVDDVLSGAAKNAFVASRPPGHHAERDKAMGFCFFNNAVIAARHAQRTYGMGRVAIVDWDVHHGNGTQAIVWEDPTILYASTHQMPLYPGTGAASERGVGNIVNAPLPPGADGITFHDAFTRRILPAVDAFAPELVIVSAGFDAHWRDPLASLKLKEEDFASATVQVLDLADRHAGGRVVSLLEGGYDLTGLADSVDAHVGELMKA
jgi:acetoin utilization deacetylase AcuC-like enzyme